MGSLGSGASVKTKIYLTGFKKFHGVADNPTEIIVGRLKRYMLSEEYLLPQCATLESCTVLESAGDGARDFLLNLLDSAIERSSGNSLALLSPTGGHVEERIIWVHLGVNSSAIKFAIEQRAVNEATFRCPDEMGWQPQRVPIVNEDGSLSHIRETTLPVNAIHSALQKQGFDVALSYDAGRFVCNYVYYHSLKHSAANGTQSLFVHVPPFSVVSEETQMEFVAALLNVLATS